MIKTIGDAMRKGKNLKPAIKHEFISKMKGKMRNERCEFKNKCPRLAKRKYSYM